MGAPHWVALFGLILAAWIMLYAMALPADLRESARMFGADFWESLCTVTPDAAGFGRVVLMWALMAAAMMAPTALPAFATYEDLGRSTEVSFGA
ncbi:MAG: metal-binding protein, partial [Rhodobacterales bacterium 34-62-10]